MKRVTYCGRSFLTTDGVADALLRLAVALPAGHSSELVELPALTDHGDSVLVQLVVAPGSEFLSLPEKTRAKDPDTVDAIDYLRERTLALLTGAEPEYEQAFADAGMLSDNGWDDLYGL
ncbi:hypothetical protein QMG61_12660 [Cryobacterium sp. PH31-AA6]|uniref:hypothetical protein n=1 Tax=Cryobacterium sp. PH31-AA6 TaxID=3046205 RepID=UPI0024B90A0E|nr:hypothetical protein [Cryobacterium sp. PH31-AA6]MDJ0324608.1 hypothetical protein [Cryobacterium sp. PH31-AA6]